MKSSKIKFFAPNGVQVPSVTSEEMRGIDRIATQETGPNLYQMMENAGRNLAALALELLGEGWRKARFVVLAGGGGNGGGGICAARHLANRNLNVEVCLSEPAQMSEVAQWQRKVFQFAGGTEITREQLAKQRPDMILDALIGYGLKSTLRSEITEMILWANACGAPILSLDVPSGLDATNGDSPGEAMHPRWTMTLALPKTGLLPGLAGELYLADIGIPKETYVRMKLDYEAPFENHDRVRLAERNSILG